MKPFKLFALAALISLLSIPAAHAQTPEASTLRVTEPLDVGGTVIQPGVYAIRVLPRFENRDQIQVMSPDMKTVYATALTVPHYVPGEPPANTNFVFYPAGEGHPAALRTWFAANADASQGGHDIVYTKSRAQQLARLSNSRVVTYEDQTQTADLNTIPLEIVTPTATVETYTYTPPPTTVATTETTTTTTETTATTPSMTSASSNTSETSTATSTTTMTTKHHRRMRKD